MDSPEDAGSLWQVPCIVLYACGEAALALICWL